MGIRVLLQSGEEEGRALAKLVARHDWRGGASVLKRDGDTVVYRGADERGRAIVVKCMALRGFRRRVQSMLGRSRLARQWRGSALLGRAGIATAKCRVLFRAGGTETLVLDWVDGPTVAELAVRGGVSLREEHAIAGAIGGQVAAIAKAGLFNRDHKASNLVVRGLGSDACVVVLIDTVGIRAGLTAVDLMLAKTAIELIGIGALPRRALLFRAIKAAEPRHTKTAWRAIAQVIARHGDPTPKVNPVAPVR
ncbi:MAG: hypothetical protein KDA20_08100 [Phycisphaerales bacterium]|nr:hypothetical protein [Phycisphaerales bacterium]